MIMKRQTLFIALLFAVATVFGQTQQELASNADNSYRMGDYPAAIENYEAVLATGHTSANLYYNLGNAYYRDGQMAKAILNYERALRLKPNMGDAKENLAIANSHTVDRITQLPHLFIVRWVDWLCTAVTPAAWRVIWLLLFAILGASVVLFCIGRQTAVRKSGFIGIIVAAVLLVCATLLLIGSTNRYNAHDEAIVMEQTITVKSSPEQQSVDKMLLHEGTKVDVLEELSGWYKIRIADGTTGWCHSASMERI